ncbi:MAG TPA: hypothetical protein VLY23_03455 [Candidatus Acidoferrum sp.]|nr:hypothetical protein [Candidatus Acidoferrum sp.]
MTRLETWLEQATRRLSTDSAAQVRAEILEHYESAREDALTRGTNAGEADRLAVAALGDARAANCQYRKVLLTSGEAAMLRNAKWEAHAVCSRPWLKWLLPAIPFGALVGAVAFFFAGSTAPARILLVGALGTAVWFAVPFLPVYTPSRARFYRGVKWLAMVAMLVLVFGSSILEYSWLLFSCLWPIVWIETTRVAIRRKLPVDQWPRVLYL